MQIVVSPVRFRYLHHFTRLAVILQKNTYNPLFKWVICAYKIKKGVCMNIIDVDINKRRFAIIFFGGGVVRVAGRKNAYDELIAPRLEEVSEWAKFGATEKQIAKNLSITQSTFCKYKKEKIEFSEALKKGRLELVTELRGALVKKALGGFSYSETRKTTKNEGGEETTVTETITKVALPDVAALNLCLKNYDPDNWANDPQMLKIKKEELKLKQKESW